MTEYFVRIQVIEHTFDAETEQNDATDRENVLLQLDKTESVLNPANAVSFAQWAFKTIQKKSIGG